MRYETHVHDSASVLGGLRVVDCTRGTAGPRATGFLADYGADVIRVEPPGGDPWSEHLAVPYAVFNRSKRVIELDLKSPGGHHDFIDLVASADVLVQSWRPDVAARLGIAFEDLHARFPSLVYGSISAFADCEEGSAIRGYEAIVHAAIGTMAEQIGLRDGPIFEGVPFAAIGAAHLLNIGLLAALLRRLDDGWGRLVHTSMFDGAVAFHAMLWGDSTTALGPTKSRLGDLAPTGSTTRTICGSFRCSDDKYLGVHTGAVGAFGRLMELLGLGGRVETSSSGIDMGIPLRPAERDLIHDQIHKVFATEPLEIWVERLLDADICGIPHLRPGEVFDSPQAQTNGMVIKVTDARLGPVEMVAPPIRFDATPAHFRGEPWQRPSAAAGFTAERWHTPPRTPRPDRRPLLAGVRVLDLGAFYAGPYASRLLADLGASVIKVEPIAGDPMRGATSIFRSAQAGKRVIALDLKSSLSIPVLTRLMRWADVVSHNMRPNAAERLGVSYADAAAVNPTVVYGYAPGWGSVGPFASRQSFEPMMSGYVGAGFEAGGQFNPPLYPAGNADPGNGLIGACATLMALIHRHRTGTGQRFEHPQLNATMTQVAHIVRRSADGSVLGAARLDPLQTGFGALERLYQTLDGWICLVALTEAEQAALQAELDPPIDVAPAGERRDADEYHLALELADRFQTKTSGEWISRLRERGVAIAEPAAHQNSAFLNDRRNLERGRVAQFKREDGTFAREIALLVDVSDADRADHREAPARIGQHSLEILEELDLSPDVLERLVDQGVVFDGSQPDSSGHARQGQHLSA